MLSPIITEYIAADRTDAARRHADHVRLVRQVRTETRPAHQARPTRKGTVAATPSRWRAWGWSLTPRAFGSPRPLHR